MSATERAHAKETDATATAVPAPVSESEYQSFSDRFRQAEIKYKLGDVDAEIFNPNNPSQVSWAFEDELIDLERLLRKYEKRLKAEQPSMFYKFLAIQAEVKDYFDTAGPAYRLDLYLQAQALLRELPTTVAPDTQEGESEERKTLKNKVRVIIAGLEYLHYTSEFGRAIAYAERLQEFVINNGLATKDNPAFGSRAIIAYFLGRTHRQRGIDDDYRKAIDYFYQCSEYYFEMARRRGNKREDVIYARTRAMVSLGFGAGFLFYNAQSDLAHAKGLIAQARLAFLKDNNDICCLLHYHYLELLYASILRAEVGEIPSLQAVEGTAAEAERAAAKDKLDRALEILERCEKYLERKPNYYVHLLYNKALLYLYQGADYYDEAHKCIDKLIDRCQGNQRWLANALIIKSHLERRVGKADAALADALRAYNQAGGHLPVLIEAQLARGQAQLARRNLTGARADFEKAYRLNNGANKKLEVMALLLLVEVAIEQQQPQVAFEKFGQAKALMPSIGHGFILNKFRQLEASIDNYQIDFVIPCKTEDIDYQKHEAALRRWLLEKALREDNNLTRVAQRLNVSKKTVYQWRETYTK